MTTTASPASVRRHPVRIAAAAVAAVAALVVPVHPASGARTGGSSTGDADAVWVVLRDLPAADVDVLYAGLDPVVQRDLNGIVDAVAGSLHA